MTASLFYATERPRASTMSRHVRDGKLLRLSTGVYSTDTATPPAAQVRDRVWELLGHLIPDAVVVDRTAAAGGRPTTDGQLFVASSSRRRDIELPGLRIVVRDGSPVAGDVPWLSGLTMSSRARTLVDNLAPSRSRGARTPRTLTPAEVEEWLAEMTHSLHTQARLDRLRDDAVALTAALGAPDRGPVIEALFDRHTTTRTVVPASGGTPRSDQG